MAACASCGSENPDGFRFCGACAAPLAAATPMREERKVVTLPFAAEAFARFGNVPQQAHALAGLGRCLRALGETEEGITHLRESLAIWERLRVTPRIAEIDALLAAAPTA